MGTFFIDRFEWGEVCICTLCAVKYKGGVSNGMWDAKSDVMRKSKNAVKQQQWGQPRRQAKRGCDGVGYSAAINPAEQWTPNGSNSQRGGLYRVKRRLHERSCRRVLPCAERETDEKQRLFSRNRTENARARVGARYVKASGKQFYQKSDGREKEYRGDRHS